MSRAIFQLSRASKDELDLAMGGLAFIGMLAAVFALWLRRQDKRRPPVRGRRKAAGKRGKRSRGSA